MKLKLVPGEDVVMENVVVTKEKSVRVELEERNLTFAKFTGGKKN